MTQQDRAPADRAHDPASGTAFAHAIEAAGRLAAQDGNIPSLDRIAADLGMQTAALLAVVGVTGFEPVAPRSQSECATKLRHTPSGRV